MPNRMAISLQILGNGWLADESVDFYYQLLANKTQISLMASVVSQAVKCLNDFSELLDVADFKTKSHMKMIPQQLTCQKALDPTGACYYMCLKVMNFYTLIH